MPRPKIKVSKDDRKLVRSLAAAGVKQEEIARMVKIRSPKTLRKYFRSELDFGALEANNKVAETMYNMATSGKCPAATTFWLKCRANWRERGGTDAQPTTAPPFVVAPEDGSKQP